MAQFAYKARRKSGEVVQGVLDVADRAAALLQIERLGLFPVAVDATKNAAAAKAERPGRKLTRRHESSNLAGCQAAQRRIMGSSNGRSRNVRPGVPPQ